MIIITELEKINQQIENLEKREEFNRKAGNMHKVRANREMRNKLILEKKELEKEAPLITIRNLEQDKKELKQKIIDLEAKNKKLQAKLDKWNTEKADYIKSLQSQTPEIEPEPEPEPEIFKCIRCNREFPTQRGLVVHQRTCGKKLG